ncbi:MAG TPA: TIR domain-containing protein [Thermoanaerobaculia bacterium]|jgi:tetratricopeptide (TPR) repeat protein|nr:TIR domain-containing protein [Thermoanaerobaculia bacterium]
MKTSRSIFISYSSQDSEIARRLWDFLKRSEIDVWWDAVKIKPGDEIVPALESALEASTHVVCLLSKAYLASPWCQAERVAALHRLISSGNVEIIPVLLEELAAADLPAFLRSRSWIRRDDGTNSWHRQVLRAILDSGKREADSPFLPPFLPRRTEFIGREQELDLVLSSFKHPRGWLTAIEGIAGIGKTSLAIEAAYIALDEKIFDAVVFTTAQHSDLSLQDVMVFILKALQEKGDLKEYDQYQLTQSLLKSRGTLLIVDNFDTLDRERAAISSFLSNLPPPSKALITSRRLERLEVTHIAVLQMKEQDALKLLRSEWGKNYPGRAVKFNFQVIWERAGGNPHFMKLVIGQLKRGMSLAQVLESLDRARGEPFNFYEDLWSVMGRDAQVVLSSVSAFAAPARWDSLLATTGISAERLEDAVESLVEMCLLEPSEEVGESMRSYQLHTLTKNFAESKLRADPPLQDEIRRRFVAHFLGIARRHGGRALDNYDILDREQKNIFAAMELLAALEDWKALVDITMQVRHFVIRQDRSSLVPPNRLSDYFAQAKYVCEKGLAAAIKEDSRKDECRLLLELGNIEIIRGNLDAAKSHLVRCIEICKEIDYSTREIMALRRLAHIEVRQGRRENARSLYEESLELARKKDDRIGIARGLRSLGDLAFEVGDVGQAKEFYGQSLECADADLDPVGMPRAARRIGNIYHRERRLDEAARQFRAVVTLYLKKNDLSGACYSLYALGRIQEDRDIYRDALECSLGSLRAIAFVHKELWAAVLTKLENVPPESGAIDSLEVYVPSVDRIISLCLDSIARCHERLGANAFPETLSAILRGWSGWEGEWINLISEIVGKCEIA